jgi:hypothetical protein
VPVSARPLVKRGVGVEVVGAVVRIGFEGRSIAEVRDPSGRLAWRGESSGPISRDLGPILKPGLYLLSVESAAGRVEMKLVR